jgi:hypothetical protein
MHALHVRSRQLTVSSSLSEIVITVTAGEGVSLIVIVGCLALLEDDEEACEEPFPLLLWLYTMLLPASVFGN